MTDIHLEEEEHTGEPADAVLFPSFTICIGVLVFYFLSRYIHFLPYTAVMFVIGTVMGVGSHLLPHLEDHLNTTIRVWTEIDSEVLLLVFLPGLIFKDSVALNVHLFRTSLSQTLIFAFPMVLAGTTLTALVAFYIFPYNWSWNLCMTFGAILSATDPVAVAALLQELGAPPRLKSHIAGEALLNDGAAIVFYGIFVERFLFELNLPNLGQDVDLAKGIGLFCRKALGGVAIGIAMGLIVLYVLFKFNRRFSREENVVQVTATLGLAYVGYYLSDFVWETSGVISTLIAGVLIKVLGRATINDAKLMEDFWTLVEHCLNTVLFTLGGAVWGTILVDENGQADVDFFHAKDWGYLFLLYIIMTAIRALLFWAAFPITKRIGLSTSWQETTFQIYGGLRGAVGIALALSLDNEVSQSAAEHTDSEAAEVARIQTRKLFGMVGGIAFLTLVINATTAGPLLRYLKLTASTEAREKIVESYRVGFRLKILSTMVRLLNQQRFKHVNFELVKSHVPYIADLTKGQLLEAVEQDKHSQPIDQYKPPFLDHILPFLSEDTDADHADEEEIKASLEAIQRKMKIAERQKNRKRRTRSTLSYMMKGEPMNTQEFRLLFISILRAAYERQVVTGELEDQHFLTIALEQSLELATDAVMQGEPLKDWHFVTVADKPISRIHDALKAKPPLLKCLQRFVLPGKQFARQRKIERSVAFMAAHRYAQEFVKREFSDATNELSQAGKIVIRESEQQHQTAERVLYSIHHTDDVQHVVSHKFCTILINVGVHYIGKLIQAGLLTEEEAEHWVEELEVHLHTILHCDVDHWDDIRESIQVKIQEEDDDDDKSGNEREAEQTGHARQGEDPDADGIQVGTS